MVPPDKMMKRIVVNVEAGLTSDNFALTPEEVPLKFIYGTSSDGLTPFENFLDDMDVGASKELRLAGSDLRSFFGCHSFQIMQDLKMQSQPEVVYLRVRLAACDEVEPREIVKAISKTVAHGNCGGGCGCGCG